MNYEEVSWYSERLHRDMRVKVYGHYGMPIIAFPCLGKQSDDFYNNGMIDTLAPYIEEGRIKLFCVDSNDDETICSSSWDKAHCGHCFEMYHQYIINEVLPFVYDKQGGYCEPFLVGLSMGGTHAANTFFRRPELFSGFISLSGEYYIGDYFGGYFNEDIYNNSPAHYLSNMPNDHYYIGLYNQKRMISVVGSGAFEYLVAGSNYALRDIANAKGINIEFHFWDENSTHDWPSWKYQLPYFLNQIL